MLRPKATAKATTLGKGKRHRPSMGVVCLDNPNVVIDGMTLFGGIQQLGNRSKKARLHL
jgi:arginine exporter protein ArgO